MRLIAFAIYLGIGALLHAAIIGPQFDWSSAWTFAWLFGWPLMLFFTFWAVVIAAVILGSAIWCVYWWLDKFAHWRVSRKRRAS